MGEREVEKEIKNLKDRNRKIKRYKYQERKNARKVEKKLDRQRQTAAKANIPAAVRKLEARRWCRDPGRYRTWGV